MYIRVIIGNLERGLGGDGFSGRSWPGRGVAVTARKRVTRVGTPAARPYGPLRAMATEESGDSSGGVGAASLAAPVSSVVVVSGCCCCL